MNGEDIQYKESVLMELRGSKEKKKGRGGKELSLSKIYSVGFLPISKRMLLFSARSRIFSANSW